MDDDVSLCLIRQQANHAIHALARVARFGSPSFWLEASTLMIIFSIDYLNESPLFFEGFFFSFKQKN